MAPLTSRQIIHCIDSAHPLEHSSAPFTHVIESAKNSYQSIFMKPPLSVSQTFNSFVSNVLDPVFQKGTSQRAVKEDEATLIWRSYLMLCQGYAKTVIMNYRRGDLVWIHDYRLLMLPHFLRRIIPDIKIGLSIYAEFPKLEQLAGVQGIAHLLKSMLQADHIGFESKADAMQFATVCQQILPSAPFSPEQIGVYSNQHMCQCCAQQKNQQKSEILKRAKQLRAMFPHKQIIFSRSSNLATVFRTLAAFADLLSKNTFMTDRTVLFLFCTSDIPAKESKSVHEIARQINQIYGNTESVPVHLYHQELDSIEEKAFMTASDLGIFLDGNSDNDAKQFILCQRRRRSPLIVHSSSSLAKVPVDCSGIMTDVPNTHNVSSITSALYDSLASCSIDVKTRYEALYQLILQNEATSTVNSFIQALERNTYAFENIPLPNTRKLSEVSTSASPAGQGHSNAPLITQQDNNVATAIKDTVDANKSVQKPSTATRVPESTLHNRSRACKKLLSYAQILKHSYMSEAPLHTPPSDIPALKSPIKKDNYTKSTTGVTAPIATKDKEPFIYNDMAFTSDNGESNQFEVHPISHLIRPLPSNVREIDKDKLPTLSLKLKAHTTLTDWHTKYLKKVSLLKVLSEYPSPIT